MADTAPSTLGDHLNRALGLVGELQGILDAEACASARSELRHVLKAVKALPSMIDELVEDIVCTECGEFNNDGEGFDGRCGNCADRASDENGEELDSLNADATEVDPVDPSISYCAFRLDDDRHRGAVFEDNGVTLLKTTQQTYEFEEEAIAAAAALYVGDESHFLDADQEDPSPTNPCQTFGAVFYDEENRWRGTNLINGEIKATTDLLYVTPAGARHGASEMFGAIAA